MDTIKVFLKEERLSGLLLTVQIVRNLVYYFISI